ncbi:MAG: Ferrous-iron efflux pump FieF [Candidatus Accumulibacter adjunctus]|uniref:Ferrous-iron efflux pump FieF n=1 Tax=Candidatus Accumulibacter adjunctus TaxID=1454001 RepID=A0A011M6I2_9PROT|nr:MAG: Ferrous-iron efflux pump FieF [Candidatus Accumulibacter adjunctus]
MYQKLTRREANRLEQRTLRLSVFTIIGLAIAGIGYGLYIGSEAVMLDGFYALTSVLGSGLYLLAARLVERPADRYFQYGYAHIEPLVNSFNSLILLVVCLYALGNGLKGLRSGGNPVEAREVVVYSLITAVVCLLVWWYERRVATRCDSQLVRNDAREWMIGTLFSVITLIGFAMVWVLPEPMRSWWARYADSAVLSLMALLLLPVPAKIFYDNMREVLRMANPDDEVSRRVNAVMRDIAAEHDIADYSTHIAKTGRIHVIEINILVGEDFALQTIPQTDALRARIWDAIGLPLEQAWLGILFTADPRWG